MRTADSSKPLLGYFWIIPGRSTARAVDHRSRFGFSCTRITLWGHWWFKYNDTWVGYWPRDVFHDSGIKNQAQNTDFGGEITYPSSLTQHTATDMGGDGTFGSNAGRHQHAAYLRDLLRIQRNFSNGTLFYEAPGTTLFTPTRPTCYDHFRTVASSPWNEYMFHGGIGFHTSGGTSNHCVVPSAP
jgi:hypothetical protein